MRRVACGWLVQAGAYCSHYHPHLAQVQARVAKRAHEERSAIRCHAQLRGTQHPFQLENKTPPPPSSQPRFSGFVA